MTGKGAFRDRANVSRETFEQLEIYADLLAVWNRRINLVSSKTLDQLWVRHFLDSAQLFQLSKGAGRWVDLGSGGGFPGAVVAIMAGASVETVLIEADQRKATFLRAVARETTGFKVISSRIEDAVPQNADVVSARALAPLPQLLEYVDRHLGRDGVAILPKGQKAQSEISKALEHWRFDCETYPSETDSNSVILIIGDIKRA
ncbi:16S rRNA (guanine(527)-N(7))-methyltransferase RsmG [Rhodobacteraceae bacterium]|nr:16S rRNA (guanine(527)-N(7))-methyltransferase RsmG [Paracoccaceae bacterium]